jgi:hypothetical protein
MRWQFFIFYIIFVLIVRLIVVAVIIAVIAWALAARMWYTIHLILGATHVYIFLIRTVVRITIRAHSFIELHRGFISVFLHKR